MAEAVQAYPDDGLPVVASRKPVRLGGVAFGAALLLGGWLVFSLMDAGRAERAAADSVLVEAEPGARISSPPPLALPQGQTGRDLPLAALPPQEAFPLREEPVRLARVPTTRSEVPRGDVPPAYNPPPQQIAPTFAQPPAVVFDAAFASGVAAADALPTGLNNRVRAERFDNPSLTIPQGTVIPAVLETALDSTRPGGVRALVQRDVRGFDGSRVLIQRGSRLYGEYQADLQAGQKRAEIRWTRLIRPDGVTIALDSPASDPLGRAGVKGEVDSKFFQRFGGALLQSVLDIGVGVATSRASDGVLVALPGSTQNVQIQDGNQIQPTLKVRHGTSVSVFVARDLDFSSVDG
ncbi:TrbI/VirB10 family protein [Parerythrobacter lacustris]|uniref:Conjugal transfer protein TrbI n=1 Tax=Parerythrobacter lacustris TaxID=2969984 RepID=A0ABT1XU59_9SPHN|nr:TrbI/VirB10 family protein [Parerythrobacter lacustris]MCR2834757.1 conjugal transfer protein TrbI [Parerythrobacter lacustris]